jgi:hypothetical protein
MCIIAIAVATVISSAIGAWIMENYFCGVAEWICAYVLFVCFIATIAK